MTDVKVEIRGLRELAAAFKQLDSELPKAMKARLHSIVTTIAGAAAGFVPVRTGKAAASVRPRSTAKGAGIAFGGPSAEYFPWLNFGGKVGKGKSVQREMVLPDRYIYTTIGMFRGEILEGVDGAIRDTAVQAGFETRGGL